MLKRTFKSLLLISLLLSASAIYADSLNCMGTNSTGKSVQVILDLNPLAITIGGATYKLTASGSNLVSESFTAADGTKQYYEISPANNTIQLTKYNAESKASIESVLLGCQK